MQNFHLLKVILACLHPSISTSTARDQSSSSLHLSSCKYHYHLSRHLQPEISHPHLYIYHPVNTINKSIPYITMYSMYNSCGNLQFSSNSHENSSMLGSNNIGDHVLSLKFEPNQQKICKL